MLYPYISVIDGFKFTSFLDPRENDSFLIEGCLTPEQADYINSHHIKSVTTKYMKEFDSLKQCPGIESICIEGKKPYGKDVPVESWTYEPSGLYNLPNLKVLQISVDENDKLVVDLKDISTLEGLRYYRNKRCINLDKAVNLKWLEIWHYREKNLMELKNLKKLESLNLTWASIVSLEGCEFLESLEELRLYYNRSLEDISALQGNADTFAFLDVENCGRISDFSVLETLENLEALRIYGRNKIPSIQFINKLKHLESFVFDINVLDGDLTPCLRLKWADCFVSRKHYNLKNDQLPKNFKTNAD